MKMEVPAKREKFFSHKGQDWFVSNDPSFVVFSMVDGTLIPSTMTGAINRLPKNVRDALRDYTGDATPTTQARESANPEVRVSKKPV